MEPSNVDTLLVLIGFCIGFFVALPACLEMRGRWKAAAFTSGYDACRKDAEKSAANRNRNLLAQLDKYRARDLERQIIDMDHKTQLDGYQNTIDRLRQTIAQAYGWLWHENGANAPGCCHKARNILLQKLDKDLQAFGISAAREDGAQPMDGVVFTDTAVFQPAREKQA